MSDGWMKQTAKTLAVQASKILLLGAMALSGCKDIINNQGVTPPEGSKSLTDQPGTRQNTIVAEFETIEKETQTNRNLPELQKYMALSVNGFCAQVGHNTPCEKVDEYKPLNIQVLALRYNLDMTGGNISSEISHQQNNAMSYLEDKAKGLEALGRRPSPEISERPSAQ